MGRGSFPEIYVYKSRWATAIHILPRGLLTIGACVFRHELLEHGYAACINYVLGQHVVDVYSSKQRAPDECAVTQHFLKLFAIAPPTVQRVRTKNTIFSCEQVAEREVGIPELNLMRQAQ